MNNIYKESKDGKLVHRLVRVSAIVILVMVWILIDKGNIYGQNAMSAKSQSLQSLNSQQQAPLLRTGDGSKGDDGLPTEDGGGDEFVVKPNPVEDLLVFDFEFTVRQAIPFEVFDPLGRLSKQGTFEPNISSQSIDFSGFDAGMYIVRLHIGDKTKVQRVIKK